MRKKTVVINTDFPLLKTGLGRNGKELANYLYKTGKYNIVYYACGTTWDSPDYARFPYKVVGSLPNTQQEIDALNRDPGQARAASYGSLNIDRVIQEFKPDVLITSNDSWASQPFMDKMWWNKIHVLPHITLDSLPFLPDQVKYMQNSKHFFVWAEFAEKEAKRLGFNHVKTLSGIIDSQHFFKIDHHKKKELRQRFKIAENAFVCGFVFRNQLRKELKPLMEGFKMFLNGGKRDAYLLLHTHFSEPAGWDIPRFCQELEIDPKYILTTYVCRHCHNYEIKPFTGQDLDCQYCRKEKTQTTCNVANGVTETDLNEVYNFMDCYCHLLNAGGLEMPLVESLYAELPLATVGYSSGEMFAEQDFVYPIKFTTTVQHGTQFIRAVPQPASVAKFLEHVYFLNPSQRADLGKAGRNWAVQRFSIEVIGKQWEEAIDSLPDHNWDFNFTSKPKNPNAVIPQINDDSLWLTILYKEILDMSADSNDEGHKYWTQRLKGGEQRAVIENYFRQVAAQENAKNQPIDFGDTLDKNDKKRVLVILPESIGDIILATAIFKSVRERYPKPEWTFYFATKPEYFELLDGNPYVDRLIPFVPQMDNLIWLEGQGGHKGYFDVVYPIHFGTQRLLNYLHNGVDKHDLQLTY